MVACASWLLLHRNLLDNGFVLRRRRLGTDGQAGLIIGMTSTLWTLAVIKTAFHTDGPLRDSGTSSGSRVLLNGLIMLSYAPLTTQFLFGVWTLCMVDTLAGRKTPGFPRLWRGSRVPDPYNWETGLPRPLYWFLMISLGVSVSVPSLLSIRYGPSAVPGVLNLAGLSLFVLASAPRNPYAAAPHRYADDALRIALPTTHSEGTMYVLPGPDRGFDAVWSPKLQAEHAEADAQIMALFSRMRAGRWSPHEPLERLRTTMARYQDRARITTAQAERLAAWIYLDDESGGGGPPSALRRIECLRAPGVHLVGRDLVFALCHAEYLVFMAAGRLRPATAAKFATLRLARRSGAGAGGAAVETVGYGRPGLDGYRAAVEHLYAMFGQPVDKSAVAFDGTPPPAFSAALGRAPASVDDYAGALWDLSTEHSESTFSALYFFTTVWTVEVGNVNGFHLFPLRARDRDGDVVTQLVAWRQAWWAACLSQLVAVSPMLFGLFVAGFAS